MKVQEIYEGYLDALRSGDRRRAIDLIDRAREAGHGIETLHLEVFQPALRQIGELWQENLLSVADEHLATAITQSAMLRVHGDLSLRRRGGPTLIAACIGEERHEVGLRMLCDFLDAEGWETVFLGATVPTEDLVRMVGERRPAAVALSVSISPHLPQLRETISAIRESTTGEPPMIMVGGRPFLTRPELAAIVGADLTATDAAKAAAALVARLQ